MEAVANKHAQERAGEAIAVIGEQEQPAHTTLVGSVEVISQAVPAIAAGP